MGGILTFIDRFYNGLIRLFAWLACALILIVTLLITYSVGVRFFLNNPIAWITEITEYTLLYITFLGAPWLLEQHGHVRLDLVLNMLSKKYSNLLEILSNVLGAVISIVLTWYGFWTVLDLYQRGITVINILKIQKYIIIMIIPISGFLLTIGFLKLTYNLVKTKRDGEQTDPLLL